MPYTLRRQTWAGHTDYISVAGPAGQLSGELPAQQLPAVGVGKVVALDDAVWRLRSPKFAAGKGPDLVGVGVGALAQHDKGNDRLTPFLIGCAHDGRLTDGGVLHEDVLDLGWCDVLAAADNGVVRAPFDKQELRAVEVGTVSGREPAVLIERRLAGQVLAGNLVAAQPELARFAGRHGPAVG